MAKNRRKKKSLKPRLKYEVYGILILIFSVIALSDEATVGRSLAKISGYALGKFYFIIPLVFIYIGLHIMLKRKWPRTWSHRQTGITLLVLGIVIMSSISLIELKLAPLGDYSAKQILSETNSTLYQQLIIPNVDEHIFRKELGGGLIGAFIHTVFYFLFGITGTKLMMYTMLGIGFMLITGLSYVDMLQFVRIKLKRIVRSQGRWLVQAVQMMLRKRQANALLTNKAKSAAALKLVHEMETAGQHNSSDSQPMGIKSLFMQLIQPNKASDREMGTNETDSNLIPSAMDSVSPDTGVQHEAPNNVTPLIRDFQDHLELENSQLENLQLDGNSVQLELPLADVNQEETQKNVDTSYTKDKPIVIPTPYELPPFHLLSKSAGYAGGKKGQQADHERNALKLQKTLESFGVRAKVLEVVKGPSVTRYEVQPDVGVKVSRIVGLTDDIALALAAKDIRMEAPIPGKSAIGIEVPNTEVSIVTMREVMESSVFHEATSKLSIILGRDISGQPIVGNLAGMPHLLVAGATGSGKSVCINGIITSILYKAKPDEVKFLMIDPKMVELNTYNGIPHLLAPVVTDPRRASLALKKVVSEMEKRYELFSKSGTRNIEGYNAMITERQGAGERLPLIVVIVDELADLMMVAANDVEDAICRLAQMARASGIHLIIATQRPSVDVITGVIKANIPSRIAFGVSSQVDSRTILDMVGAEKLLGRGDMLFLPVGASKPIRVQGAFLSDQEVESVVQYVRQQEQAQYQEEMVPELDEQMDAAEEFVDELFNQAVQIVLEAKQASVSLLQRRMRVGYTRAARLIDSMEAKGIVGPYEGSKPREVLLSMEQFEHSQMSS